MTMEHRPGLWFQDFVAALERHFADRPDVKVESPVRLRDRHTGGWREHDVILRHIDHHGTILTAVECKDEGRKIGVPDIEAFRSKLEATGVHRAFVVSSSGFYKSARKKASAYNIGCVELSAAENLDWVELRETEPQYLVSFPSIRFEIVCGDQPPPEPITFFDRDGKPLTRKTVENIARSTLPPGTVKAPNDATEWHVIRVEGTGIYAIDAAGTRYAPDEILIKYRLLIESFHPEWRLHRYASDATNFEMASAEFTLLGRDRRFFVIREEGGKSFRLGLSKIPPVSKPARRKRQS